MTRVAAFFDMDLTLLRINSGSAWIKFLRRRGEISLWRTVRAMSWIARYKLALLDMEAVTAKATRDIAGSDEAEMAAKARRFFDEMVAPAVSAKGRDAVERHRAAGDVIAILSSSTPYVVEPLARHLGIEHALCTRFDIVDGKFAGTHRKPACFGVGKVHYAEAFARAHDVDLDRSFFYTDSYSDLPMLERVGERRVVNPDPRLGRHARRLGWPTEEW